MNCFSICQLCRFCQKGSRVFNVDLSCYNADGQLNVNPMQLVSRFSFQCQFCNHVSTLEFERFSHPDLIRYLKDQSEKRNEIQKLLDSFNSLLM